MTPGTEPNSSWLGCEVTVGKGQPTVRRVANPLLEGCLRLVTPARSKFETTRVKLYCEPSLRRVPLPSFRETWMMGFFAQHRGLNKRKAKKYQSTGRLQAMMLRSELMRRWRMF